MARTITETRRFDRDQLVAMAMFAAKNEIIDGFYVGDFHEQRGTWMPDGSLVVETSHVPGDIAEWRNQKS